MSIKRQSGGSTAEFLVGLACALAGGTFVHIISSVRLEVMSELAKYFYYFVGLFGVLMGLTEYVRRKLDDLSGHDYLSPREQERLHGIVRTKQRKLFIIVIFYMFAMLYMIGIAITSRAYSTIGIAYLDIAGIIAGLSVFFLGDTWMEQREVSDFNWKLDQRYREKQDREAALKKLSEGSNEKASKE